MKACLDWLAADFLRRNLQPYDQPPCRHPAADCPPLATTTTKASPR